MQARVMRKDGTEEIHRSEPVAVELPADLVREYKALRARQQEIEAIFLSHMTEGK